MRGMERHDDREIGRWRHVAFDDGDGRDRLCEWADQWCDEPAYGWIDTWLPDTAGDARAGRIHACQRHYAFHLETTIDAILHDPEHMAATNDEQRRVAVLRHVIAFGRE